MIKSGVLSVSSSEETIVVSLVSKPGTFRVLGYSNKHADEGLSTTLVVPKGDAIQEILAITFNEPGTRFISVHVISVTRNHSNNAIWISLDKDFAPPADSLYKVREATGYESESGFDVEVEGEWFTTITKTKLGMPVVDGDTLCRYLAGKIFAEDVRAAAGEVERQKTLEEKLTEAEEKLLKMEKKLTEDTTELHHMYEQARRYAKENDDTRATLYTCQETIKKARQKVEYLREFLDNAWVFGGQTNVRQSFRELYAVLVPPKSE